MCTCFVDGLILGWTNDQFSVQPGGITFTSPTDSASSSDTRTGAVAQITNVGRNGAMVVNISSILILNITSDQFNGTRIGCYDSTGVMNAQTVTLDLRGMYIINNVGMGHSSHVPSLQTTSFIYSVTYPHESMKVILSGIIL